MKVQFCKKINCKRLIKVHFLQFGELYINVVQNGNDFILYCDSKNTL